MRATACLAAFCLALAGCSGSESTGEVGEPTSDGSSAPSPSATSDIGDTANRPPIVNFSAENVTGAAPFNATFTIDASDEDGDALSWSLDANGDGMEDASGAEVPGNFSFLFEVPGQFVANLTVSDGSAVVNASLAINVTDAADGAAPVVQSFSATFTFGIEGCWSWAAYDAAARDPLTSAGGSLNGTTRIQFNVEPLSIGHEYAAVFTFDQGFLFLYVAFYSAANALLDSNVNDSPAFGGFTMRGVVPEGAAKGVLWACGGPNSSSVVYSA